MQMEVTCELTLQDICEKLQIKQRSAYNFVSRHNLQKFRKADGQTVYLVPEAVLQGKELCIATANLHPSTSKLKTRIVHLQDELLHSKDAIVKLQKEVQNLQAECAKKESSLVALNNQITASNSIIQRVKQLEEELRRIPPWIIHLIRMFRNARM